MKKEYEILTIDEYKLKYGNLIVDSKCQDEKHTKEIKNSNPELKDYKIKWI